MSALKRVPNHGIKSALPHDKMLEKKRTGSGLTKSELQAEATNKPEAQEDKAPLASWGPQTGPG